MSGLFEGCLIESREAWILFGGVLTALLAATAAARLLERGTTRSDLIPNLKLRIRSWWVMILLLAGTLFAGRAALILLFAFISFAALREFLALTQDGRTNRAMAVMIFGVMLPAQYLLIWFNSYPAFAMFIPGCALLILPLLQAATSGTRGFLARTAAIQWGVIFAVYFISYTPALLMLRTPPRAAALLVAFSLLVVQASDVLQYVFGKYFGRHPIAPAISPSKTVEGFAGGVIGASLLGACLWRVTPFRVREVAALSVAISLAGFAGGLVLSAVKRDRGAKDWGHIVDGHGGVLDRMDSVCFMAPVFFHAVRHLLAV